jgi:uncharacterized protein (DUF58 family)
VLAASLGLYAVASGVESDRGPLVLVGAAAWAVLAVGIVWPIVALRRVRVTARVPRDAFVGDHVPVSLTVHARSALQLRTLDPPSPWHVVYPGAESGTIRHLAARRGVMTWLRVEVRSGAPLGVFLRRRSFTVAVEPPLYIAPRPRRASWFPTTLPEDAARDARDTAARLGGDAVRSVRPYVAGDAARLVHWPTSARRGSLVVRELEPPPRLGMAVAVDLRAGGPLADDAAARAAGLALAVLRGGGECLLLTTEASGPVAATVSSARDVGRRLAAAVSNGAPPAAPPGWPVEVVS